MWFQALLLASMVDELRWGGSLVQLGFKITRTKFNSFRLNQPSRTELGKKLLTKPNSSQTRISASHMKDFIQYKKYLSYYTGTTYEIKFLTGYGLNQIENFENNSVLRISIQQFSTKEIIMTRSYWSKPNETKCCIRIFFYH